MMFFRDGQAEGGMLRDAWYIDPVLASVASLRPCRSGYCTRFEPDGESVRLWTGMGVLQDAVLGECLRSALAQPQYRLSLKPLFRKLDATGFVGQGSWVRSFFTGQDGAQIRLTSASLEQAPSLYAPLDDRAVFSVMTVERLYKTADELELDTDHVAEQLLRDFGPLYNGLFPRSALR